MSKDLRFIGKIDSSIISDYFGQLTTDSVVITSERWNHIIMRHTHDVSLFEQYATEAVQNPDIILVDAKNASTIFVIKQINEGVLCIVVKLVLGYTIDMKYNSVITAHRLRNRTLKQLIKKNIVLYMRCRR